MAEKRIEIQMAAVGAEQTAAQIAKANDAIKDLGNSLDEGGSGSGGGVAPKAKRAQAGLKDVGEEVQKVERSSRNSGAAILSLSQGFEDLQYGIRGVLNNIPPLVMQLGGGAGLAGVISLAAVSLSILGPKLASMLDDAPDPKEFEALNDRLATLKKRISDVADQKATSDKKAWIASLDDEEAAITRNNNALERSIALMQAKRRADAEVASAQAALDLAKIDADPNMSEADKIRARAGVQDRIDTQKAATRIASAGDAYDASSRKSDDLQGKASRAADDASRLGQDAASQQARIDELSKRKNEYEAGKQVLPGLQKELANLSRPQYGPMGEYNPYTPSEAEAIKRVKDQIESAKSLKGLSDRESDELKRLQGDDGKGGTIAQVREAQVAKKKEADDLAAAAAKAAEDAKLERQKAELEQAAAAAVLERQRQARALRTNQAANQAQERADDSVKKESLENDLHNREGSLNDTAQSASGAFQSAASAARANGATGISKTIGDIGKRLANGTNPKELELIEKQFNEATKNLGGSTISVLRNVIAKMEDQAKKITELEGQVQNLRRGR